MTAENVMLLLGFSSVSMLLPLCYLPFLQRRDVTHLVLALAVALSIVRVLPLLTFAYSVVMFPKLSKAFLESFHFLFQSGDVRFTSNPIPSPGLGTSCESTTQT